MARPQWDTPLVLVYFSGQQYFLWAETLSLFIFWGNNILMGRAWAERLSLLGPGTRTIALVEDNFFWWNDGWWIKVMGIQQFSMFLCWPPHLSSSISHINLGELKAPRAHIPYCCIVPLVHVFLRLSLY